MARRKRKLVLGGKGGQFDNAIIWPATCTTIHFPFSGGSSGKKQTIDQTTVHPKTDDCWTKSDRQKKPWTALATALKRRWFAEVKKRKRWISRTEFFTEFFDGTEGQRKKWKGLKVSTENRRFQDNQEQWKSESETLKASLKNRR